MSPAPRHLQGLVDAVRRHLTRRALVAVAALARRWSAACVLVAAWLLAGPEGWTQGSGVPLVLDVVLLVLAGVLLAWGHRGSRRWFAEAPLARAMERAAGVRPGVVRGSLELTRAVPAGVSRRAWSRGPPSARSRSSSRPVRRAVGRAGPPRCGRWTRRASGALAATAVVLDVLAVAAPARAGRAWPGLSHPVRLMAKPVLPAVVVTPGDVEVHARRRRRGARGGAREGQRSSWRGRPPATWRAPRRCPSTMGAGTRTLRSGVGADRVPRAHPGRRTTPGPSGSCRSIPSS